MQKKQTKKIGYAHPLSIVLSIENYLLLGPFKMKMSGIKASATAE